MLLPLRGCGLSKCTGPRRAHVSVFSLQPGDCKVHIGNSLCEPLTTRTADVTVSQGNSDMPPGHQNLSVLSRMASSLFCLYTTPIGLFFRLGQALLHCTRALLFLSSDSTDRPCFIVLETFTCPIFPARLERLEERVLVLSVSSTGPALVQYLIEHSRPRMCIAH